MPAEKTAEAYRPNPLRPPKHRADCADFYRDPMDTNGLDIRGPVKIYGAIEEAAARADRTFCEQMEYVADVCRGVRALDVDDAHSLDDWRALLGEMQWYSVEGRCWVPFSVLFTHSGEASRVS